MSRIIIAQTDQALREAQAAHQGLTNCAYSADYILRGRGTLDYVDGSSDIHFFLSIDGLVDNTVVGLPDGFNGNIQFIGSLTAAYDGTAEVGNGADLDQVVSVTSAGSVTYAPGTAGVIIAATTTNKAQMKVITTTNGFKVQISQTEAGAGAVECLAYARVKVRGAVTLLGDNFVNDFPQMTEVTGTPG